jgi:hypothetical protein
MPYALPILDSSSAILHPKLKLTVDKIQLTKSGLRGLVVNCLLVNCQFVKLSSHQMPVLLC